MIHGGDIYSYKQGRELLDFSSNINPLGPPACLTQELVQAISELTAYPDAQYRELKERIADYLGCTTEQVIAGNGSMDVMQNCCLMHQRTVVLEPCFSEYAARSRVVGKPVLTIRLHPDFSIPLQALDLLEQGDLLLLGNPNNPNGGRIPKDILLTIVDLVERQGAFLLLDEAFYEFCPPDYDSAALFRNTDHVGVIRAATKFYALPGIRLGYGQVSPGMAKQYWETAEPWAINSFANAAARCIFQDLEYQKKTLALITEERNHLTKELSRFSWMKVIPGDANYLLLQLLEYDEDILFEFLLGLGILIRKASNFTGLSRQFIRIAVKDKDSNLRLIQGFQEFDRRNQRKESQE